MPLTVPQLLFSRDDQRALFRLVGKPSLDLSNHLRATAERLRADGCREFTLDLGLCPSVDSTFIGVLLLMAKQQRKADPCQGAVCLLNANELVRRQIDSLGVLDRFQMATADASGVHFQEMQVGSAGKSETTRLCLEAHRHLIEACAGNAAKFQDVVKFLEADLQPPDGARAG